MTSTVARIELRSPAPPTRRRRRRLFDVLRYALPALALAMIALVVLWPQIVGGGRALVAPIVTYGEVDGADVMQMRNPRYMGRTKTQEPYEVTAASAYLDPSRPQYVHLDELVADLDRGSSADLELQALKGVYDRDRRKLDLSGGIELITSDGYRFKTDAARVLLDHGTVIGRQPIQGRGPSGTLEADRFEIRDGGDVLHFEGRVKVTVQPAPARDRSS